MKQCYSCFGTFEDAFNICPHCGAVHNPEPEEPIYLVPGTVLADRYVIGKCVGAGGFGIVYMAWDPKLEAVLAVKEFFVSRLVTRAQGEKELIVSKKYKEEYEYRKGRFLAEARTMAKFNKHRSIPNVYDFFEENGTAYIVMELLKGEALNSYRQKREGQLDIDFAIMVAGEVGEALISLHKEGIIHCDVAPDNVFICNGETIRIKLMDLGAAKMPDRPNDVIDIILKPGYSPTEQYNKENDIGPWTDVYALGATLYSMLTGVKPDESTNRAIKDELVPPMELNPEISENLNNAILKAMALDKHMRFGKVSEFLEAIKGERKVLPLDVERKQRNRKRTIRVVAACVIMLAGLAAGLFTYKNKRQEGVLDPATISVWYALENGENENAAMDSVRSQFTEVFPDVTIELKGIPAEEYEEALLTAMQEGSMPTLYESTGVSEEILQASMDLDEVVQSEQFKAALFLNQYKNYYANTKQIPLGIELPIACVITKGPACIDYDSDYFSAVSDFGAGTQIAMDDRYEALLEKNFQDLGAFYGLETFMNNEENTSPVLLTSSMTINEIRAEITNYQKEFIYLDSNKIFGRFTYEWSISGGSDEQVAAAERLLSWMLGNVYQQTLMVGMCNDGQIPVNPESFNAKLQANGYLAPLRSIYSKFAFVPVE